jgi:hypothetical protein
MSWLIDPELRRSSGLRRERLREFKRDYSGNLHHNLNPPGRILRSALCVSRRVPSIEVEVTLLKALELAAVRPSVLMNQANRMAGFYEVAGVKGITRWNPLGTAAGFETPAAKLIDRCRSLEDVLAIEYEGARVGRTSASTLLREFRQGSLDLQTTAVREALAKRLSQSMAAATSAQHLIRKVRPEFVLSVDTEYTPEGELFDICMTNGVDVIAFRPAHRNSALMFKRYRQNNRDQHPASLSEESWDLVRHMQWNDERSTEVQNHVRGGYARKDWYGLFGTQFNKSFMDAATIQKHLGLDPSKKTAVVFPHTPWDSPFSWGRNLFETYEEWLTETVRAACHNDRLNWIVKIHPAQVGKSLKEGYKGAIAEVLGLEKSIGCLPAHVFLLPPDTSLATVSVLDFMDYCLTVRGTVGIEAAVRGVPVLTGGTGRYDGKGFTVDSNSRREYLERLDHIDDLTPLSSTQRELAERFAYGVFVLRPLPLTTVTFEFTSHQPIRPDTTGTRAHNNVISRIHITSREQWRRASDLKAFGDWVNSTAEDFLLPVPGI